jgi:hypothetical protein
LAFVAAAVSGETNYDREPCALGLRAPAQLSIASRQKFEIVETDASQARRTRRLHHQEFTGAAAPVAHPLAIEGLDHHQIRRAADLFIQVFTAALGKLGRYPVGAIEPFERGISAPAARKTVTSKRDIEDQALEFHDAIASALKQTNIDLRQEFRLKGVLLPLGQHVGGVEPKFPSCLGGVSSLDD